MTEKPLLRRVLPRPHRAAHATNTLSVAHTSDALGLLRGARVLAPLVAYVRQLFAAKLGRCSLCMRAAFRGTLGAWLLLLAMSVFALHPLLVTAALVVALGFSGLVLAHAVAFIWHATRTVPNGPCCGQRQVFQPLAYELRQVQRRSAVRAITALPAAFGLTQLVGVPRVAAQAPGTITATKTFRKTLSCPPCDGECVFEAFFEYDYVPLSGGKIQVTRYRMTWNQGSTGDCTPSIDRGMGAFDFQCVDDSKPCKLTGGNIWQCACDTRIEFVPLGDSSQEDCICPNQKNRVAYAQGVCGAPIAVEKTCNFQWINIDFRHKVTCSCPDGRINRGDLVVVAQFQNGTLSFGGDVL